MKCRVRMMLILGRVDLFEVSRRRKLRFLHISLTYYPIQAHWFDMSKFWAQAAQLLRPGGTVAIWVRGAHYARNANSIHILLLSA
jgi:hypothetical protein